MRHIYDWKRYFKFWLIFYAVYWVILICWFVWIITSPNLVKIICWLIGLGFQVFNTTQIKKIKEIINTEIKEGILEKLK